MKRQFGASKIGQQQNLDPLKRWLSIRIWGVEPKIGGKPPKWMVYFMENPIKIFMIWGYPYFGSTHIFPPQKKDVGFCRWLCFIAPKSSSPFFCCVFVCGGRCHLFVPKMSLVCTTWGSVTFPRLGLALWI